MPEKQKCAILEKREQILITPEEFIDINLDLGKLSLLNL